MGKYITNNLKQMLLGLMQILGVIRLFQYLHRKRIMILMIHGVMDEKGNPSWIPLRPQLSPEKLEEYLKVLSGRYHFISLMDAVKMIQGTIPLQTYSMVLTFDDGYRNNFTYALPILRRYNAPATFFISTDFVHNPRPFWWDRLDYALQQAQVNSREVKIGSLTMRIDKSSRSSLRESYKDLRDTVKQQLRSDEDFLREMEKLAVQLEHESGHSLAKIQKEDDWSAILSWDEIAGEDRDDVTIGSHTADHIRLGIVENETARDQLIRSKKDIEAHIHKPCFCISYPNGSFNEQTIDIARECGYTCGVTIEDGLNNVGDDPMTLKRISLPADVGSVELLGLVNGVSEILNNIKERILIYGKLFEKVCKIPKNIYKLIQRRGIKRALMRIGSELYSESEYVVAKHDLSSQVKIISDRLQIDISEITKYDTKDIEDVCKAWPSEFGYWRTEGLKSRFIHDLENGYMCFAARSNGDVIGAIWISKCDEIIMNCPGHHYQEEMLFCRMFVVAGARGRGLSKLLLNHIIMIAKEKGMSQLYGYTLLNRAASLKAQLSVGFKILGNIKVKTRMGRNKYIFLPADASINMN
jgi:peptidoglycan/xylan/chitin deacetylase (PgdA/CDA1 family)/GNAT superfamily N-acetyltransferase